MDTAHQPSNFELLLIGGRSGAGKSSVGQEVSHQLATGQVAHVYIEGDFLDSAYPWHRDLFEKNLKDFWANYTAAGYRRLIYTNTASISSADDIVRAMGGPTRIIGALLTCTTQTAHQRLARREIGSELAWHLKRTEVVGEQFADIVLPDWATRVPTDDRTVIEIARELVKLTGWLDTA